MTVSIDIGNSDNPSVVLTAIQTVKFEDRPIPKISDPHDVKIEVKKTGCCHSDVLYYDEFQCGSFKVKDPMVLGHESSGVVVEVGSAVRNLKVGDEVAMEPGVPSRYSREYKFGYYNLCSDMKFAATPPIDGTLARYYILPEDFCYKLPQGVSLEEGAMVEPLSVGVHANRQVQTKFGDRVVIMGAGTIGLVCASVAKAFGATDILLVDLVQQKLDFAKDVLKVATHVYNGSGDRGLSPDEVTLKQLALFGGEFLTVGFDCTGFGPCITLAIKLVGPKGRYCQVGMGAEYTNNFPIFTLTEREIQLVGSSRYDAGCYEIAVKLIATKGVDVKPFITHRFKFEQVEELYELLKSGLAIKVMVDGPVDTRSDKKIN